jgi:hypothetical protein
MANTGPWNITCTDAFGRQRNARVSVIGEHIVLATPPGEAAFLTWSGAEEFRRAMQFAVVAVLSRQVS